METERFAVPEVLFSPQDIGMAQAGVAEAAAQSLQLLHPMESTLAASRIILTGVKLLTPIFMPFLYTIQLRATI